MRKLFFSFAVLALTALPALAQQSNFQIAPAPIAYPYFEPQRTDIKFTGTYFSLSATDIDITGGGVDFIFRRAASETLAFDAQLGLFGLGGKMPGFALPFIYSGVLWTPVVEGKASLSGFSLPLSFNLEIQPVHTPGGSLLLFAGPMFSMTSLTITTPYHAEYLTQKAVSTNFVANAFVALFGAQAGLQGSIPLKAIKLAPFVMGTTQSGTSSLSFEHGYTGVRSLVTTTVTDIEPFTTQSFGMDIIVVPWNLSIGTMLQQAAAKKNQAGFKTTLITLSWHFRS